MTQRTILAGSAPEVVVHAGINVIVRGWEGEQISAETRDRWGLKIEHKEDTIQVNLGGSGEVRVPLGSSLKVYAGKDIEVHDIHGEVTAIAGLHVTLREVTRLAHVSAGGKMDIECQSVVGNQVKFSTGSDMRLYIRELTSALLEVHDLGGRWDARIGGGGTAVKLNAGGDVTLVTDQPVEALPPDYILGKIEKPGEKNSG